jgi:hypothetical protein
VNETSINADVSGGAVGVVGAHVVRIENLYVGAAGSPEPAKPAGPIPPCPYPGLAYFGPEDAYRFFGREQAIQALVAAVAKRSSTALVGASGSGKSSVVLAGLAPRLETQGGWRSSYFRIGTEPDKNPFSALARALEPLTGDRGLTDKLKEVNSLATGLAEGSVGLTNVLAACRAANGGKRILLIADQFEELFTLVSDEALRSDFIDTIIAAFSDPPLGVRPDICLVLTIRADFYNAALRHRPLADRLQDHVQNLGPMTRDELRDAIVEPAKASSVEFEPGLVNTILDDVEKRPGTLPLLQFAVREMWGRLKAPLMTRAQYEAIGGVEAALAQRAQAIFEEATKNERDAAVAALFRRLFTRLVTLGEGAEDTRRIVGRDELGPDAWALAQRLAGEDNRLVVTAAPTPGRETAEIVHEALIRNWPALVEWVNRDRAFQSWLRQLKPRVDDWRANRNDEGTLLRGGPLAVAEDWVLKRGGEINDEEKAFVAAGLAQRDAERQRAENELEERQTRLEQVARAQEDTARAQREMAEAQAETASAQRQMRWALVAVASAVAFAGFFVYWQHHINVLLDTYLRKTERTIDQQQVALKNQLDKTLIENARLANIEFNERTINDKVKTIGGIIYAKTIELRRAHANLLGELSAAELARGNIDTALRLATLGVGEDLRLQLKSDPRSPSIAALTATVSEATWRAALSPGQKVLLSEASSHRGSGAATASDRVMRIGGTPPAAISARGLLGEVCRRRPFPSSTMTRDEMRLAGYPDSEPPIDVCAGSGEAGP